MVFPVFQIPGFQHVPDKPQEPAIANLLRQGRQHHLVIQRAERIPDLLPALMTLPRRFALLREDFLRVAVEVRCEVFRCREVAAVDFAAAADTVQGVLPCSSRFSEQSM